MLGYTVVLVGSLWPVYLYCWYIVWNYNWTLYGNRLFFSSRQLITHLKVFAKFTNPRSLYLESSLSELYNQVIQTPRTHILLQIPRCLNISGHSSAVQKGMGSLGHLDLFSVLIKPAWLCFSLFSAALPSGPADPASGPGMRSHIQRPQHSTIQVSKTTLKQNIQ